ncbi:MAG: endo alpha-1,4 polygalactosaminidase [Alphaproteobacteria bacterium]
MIRRLMAGALAVLAVSAVSGVAFAAESWAQRAGGRPWVVYYADKEPPEAFDPFTLLVLDSENHPPLRPLVERGKVLLGYISVGEVESHRPWYAKVKRWGILSDENPNWKGSFYVDLRDPRWTALVVEELVPMLLRRGFDGVFLDTLDNPVYLEQTQPKKYKGIADAAAQLVRAIRRNYPTIPIMMNRAYPLLPRVERDIDFELGESVYADYDFKTKTYQLVDRTTYLDQVKFLKDAQRRRPELRVMTLDYWSPADPEGIRRIYKEQRANGFDPYVATIDLDRLVKEPAP